MVYFSHNWGMGDSDCIPCYKNVVQQSTNGQQTAQLLLQHPTTTKSAKVQQSEVNCTVVPQLSPQKKALSSSGENNNSIQQLLRPSLTPAQSEEHHDSDYEISIHPLSNQVGELLF